MLQHPEKSIDKLVQEVRSQAYPDSKDGTKHPCKTMRMLRVNHPVPVDGIYVKLNVLNRISSFSSFSDWQSNFQSNPSNFDRWGLGTVNQSQVSALSMVQKSSRLMVLGKPGSGKTTFLKSLLVECIEGRLRWNQQDYVPIFITLKDFAKASQKQLESNLSNYIYQEFYSWGLRNCLKERQVVEKFLAEGRALILLDGLDEVPEEIDEKSQELDQESVINEILNFSKSNNRIVITCRTQSQQSMWEGFTDVEIADFEQEEREEFVKKWFAVVNGNAESDKLAEQLIWQLREPKNQQITRLAVTPILLNLICVTFRDGDGKLPKNRADFYEDGVTILLKDWDATKPAKGVKRKTVHNSLKGIDDKKRLLAKVAAILFEDNDYFPKQEKLKKLFSKELDVSPSEAEEVIKSFEEQSGLLVERHKGIWSFSHLTFQEYFAAKWFCDRADWESLAMHVTKKHWREVFLLTVGITKSADKLLPLMKQQIDTFLVSDEMLQQFLKWVSHRASVENLSEPVFIRALRLNPGRDGVFIPPDAYNLDLSVTFDFNRIRDVDSLLKLDHDLDCIYYLVCAFVSTLSFDGSFLATKRPLDFCFDISSVSRNVSEHMRGYQRALYGKRIHRDSLLTCKFQYEQSVQELYHLVQERTKQLIDTLSSDSESIIPDLELKQKLQDMKNQLPDAQSDSYKWWQERGQSWTEELQLAMVKYCNNGRAWLLNSQQKELLNQYYDANRLLVDCLNSGCKVSDEVRKEIEETLLLPIDEIEKHQQQRQVADVADG